MQLLCYLADLFPELVTGSKNTDPGVKNAMLKALYEVVSKAGANMSETSRNAILGLIDSDTDDRDGDYQRPASEKYGLISLDAMAITHARLLGALIKNLPSTSATALIK